MSKLDHALALEATIRRNLRGIFGTILRDEHTQLAVMSKAVAHEIQSGNVGEFWFTLNVAAERIALQAHLSETHAA